MAEETSDLAYLLPSFRLTIGDTDQTAYRYLDEWLQVSLITAVKSLGRWWTYRYLVDASNKVYRNPAISFPEASPPIILFEDERPIILMASYILLEGSLENMAWNISSWRDAEISYTNLESGKIRDNRIERIWRELTSILTPPSKKLALPVKGSLPGYKNNRWERDTEY